MTSEYTSSSFFFFFEITFYGMLSLRLGCEENRFLRLTTHSCFLNWQIELESHGGKGCLYSSRLQIFPRDRSAERVAEIKR